jgi:hypothetical protein
LTKIWSRDRADQGGVAVIVAIVAASGLLLTVGALVVDVGLMMAEREELQTGADAAAVRIAQACASAPGDCDSTSGRDLASDYADRNASDGAAGVTAVCGTGGDLDPCPSPGSVPSQCVQSAPSGVDYVEVRLHTRLPDGGTLLPPTFAGAAVAGYSGATVRACARAAWGAPTTGALALTISVCEWQRHTSAGTSFAVSEAVIYLHAPRASDTCEPTGPSGADAPGGFGWLDDPDGTCEPLISLEEPYRADPGTDFPAPCQSLLPLLRDSRKPTLIPVHQQVTGGGRNTTYTALGFAAFVVTGWHLGGNHTALSNLTGRRPCGNPDRCLAGYFTQALVAGSGPIGGPGLGATVVTLLG